eukprot:gnl/MRDRNA2_/MRDRNA2_55379_c0_seq1.p1 gnl/MRDRNA2_/MRDRNA2_55379_c0~~gnl/MRDRNA2_/MRDRNA2_55379_c0_seq1.p1  ORF type:complete len:302 (-),score=52.44 gnl/MRDRNA2_/MRDRNA2_55379_c0_seq1:189-1094(-)
MIESHRSDACSLPVSSLTRQSSFLKVPQILSALACRRRRNSTSRQLEDDSVLELSSNLSLQHMAESWPSMLPEMVSAAVLEFAGPSGWYLASCASKEWHQVLWQSPTPWSCVLLSLGEEPGRIEQDVGRQRDRVRKCWFGITNFIMQGPQLSVGCDALLIEDGIRAIKGLQKTDSVDEVGLVLERCLGLLRTFAINDTMARNEAMKLEALIASRTDIFKAEQSRKATDALAEATELGDLLDDALQMEDLVDLDSLDENGMEALAASAGAWCCEDEVFADSEASEEALDRLLSVLRDAIKSN